MIFRRGKCFLEKHSPAPRDWDAANGHLYNQGKTENEKNDNGPKHDEHHPCPQAAPETADASQEGQGPLCGTRPAESGQDRLARRVEAWARSQAAKRPETFGCYRILSAGSLQRLANRLRRAVNDLTARNVPRNEWPSAFVMGFQPKVRAPYRTKKRMQMVQEYIQMYGIPPGTPGVPQEFIEAAAAQRKAAAAAAQRKAAAAAAKTSRKGRKANG